MRGEMHNACVLSAFKLRAYKFELDEMLALNTRTTNEFQQECPHSTDVEPGLRPWTSFLPINLLDF